MKTVELFAAGLIIASTSGAFAQSYRAAPQTAPPLSDPSIIAGATARAQHEPGVTEELAPDAKQTATGGPAGGVPGLSGGH